MPFSIALRTHRPRRGSPFCMGFRLFTYVLLSACFRRVQADLSTETYNFSEPMQIWSNKIGPYTSPTESYGYYDKLAWCRPETLERHPLKLGETLAGDFLVKSQYELKFRDQVTDVELCEKALTEDQVKDFVDAIRNRFVYELLLDDLPMKLFVGELADDDVASRTFLYTHVEFVISFNKQHVIEAVATPGQPVEIKQGQAATVRFSYSVKWDETDFPYSRRAEKYRDPSHSHDLEIHWYSIGSAMLSVFLLMGLLGSILLRVIRKDFHDYEALYADDETDDYGWKLVHGDVFRFPPALTLLCPCLGTGVQLLLLSFILLLFGLLEVFHPLSHGTIYTAAVCCYALTTGVAGFVSGYLYKQMGGSAWIRNAFVTVLIFCGPAAAISVYLNLIALAYQSTRALPVWTIFCITALWAVVSIPLTIIGAILGKNRSRPFDAPVRTAKIAREIPACPWYRRPAFVVILCGLVPFSSIYVELYFMFGALWGHKIFQVYEMLSIVFTILIIVTTITTVSAVYFQLVVENYKWAWSSVAYGGSVGVYMFVYSVHYFGSSPLKGFMQANFFFGNMFLVSYAFFLMCGAVGFFSARRFVRFLYSSVKSD